MKKVICLVDFSPVSDSVVEYIAGMAKETKAKVVLVPVQKNRRKAIAGMSSSGAEDTSPPSLYHWHDLLTTDFHVPCEIEEELFSAHDYNKLSTTADEYDMLIFGISPFDHEGRSKSDGMLLNPLSIIKTILVPTLIIPGGLKYRKTERLLYAFDCSHHPPSPPLAQLSWLADWFDADVHFISVIPGVPSTREEDTINSVHNNILQQWKKEKTITFETIQYHNVARCLEHYLDLWRMNDLLVLSVNHSNTWKRLWHKSIVKSLINDALHTFLIIHY